MESTQSRPDLFIDFFKTATGFPALKPCLTTWMSATVGTSFLGTTDRKRDGLGEPSSDQVAFDDKLTLTLNGDHRLQWWRDARHPVEWCLPDARDAKTSGASRKSAPRSKTIATEAIAEVADLLGPWCPGEKSDTGVVPETEPRQLRPFVLAYLGTLVRIADWRASERPRRCKFPTFMDRGQWRVRRAELHQRLAAQPRGGDGGGRGE